VVPESSTHFRGQREPQPRARGEGEKKREIFNKIR